MQGRIIDTNHLSPSLKPVSPVRDRIFRLHRDGFKLGTCIPVLCELESGIQLTRHVEKYRRQLDVLMRKLKVWPIDPTVRQLFGQLSNDLQRRGRVLSHADIVLAALATRFNLAIVTADRDFEALPQIRTENWLTS
jgi:predicted nucleic acid-binding protein